MRSTEPVTRRRATVLALGVVSALSVLLGRLPLSGADTVRRFDVVDLHVDLSYQVNYQGKELATATGQFVASELLRAGVVGVVLPLYIPRKASPDGPRLEDLVASREKLVKLLPETEPYQLPGCEAHEGKVRTWFAFEGAAPLAAAAGAAAEDPASVESWLAQGVRVFGLVHTYDNALATSSGEKPPKKRGLTDAGHALVRRIYAAGGIVDVSHASDAATRDVIALARAAGRPVIATHSNARKLAAHPRNLTDELLRGIASTGGVAGVNFHAPFVARGRSARLADVVKQVKYLLRVAGEDHVAIGSDFEGDIRPAKGLEDVHGYQRLARALLEAGLTEAQIEKVFAANALRVLCP